MSGVRRPVPNVRRQMSGRVSPADGPNCRWHLEAISDYLAPDASDTVYQDAARFFQYKRTAQSPGEYSAKFDLRRRKAESRMQPGGPPPEAFISMLRMQDASLSRSDRSLLWRKCDDF